MEPNPKDIEPNFIETYPDGLNIVPAPGGSVMKGGAMQSPNYNKGVAGWKLDADGNIEANNGTFRGNLEANSINIPDTTTANSFHVDSSGNAWWGATTLASSIASILKDGVATFQGMTSLNMKAYTTFETAARFISTVGGSGSNSFGNQGVTVAPGTTATSYARLLWWITQYVFNNNPSFTCSILALGGFASGDGRGYIGLGAPAVDGNGITRTSQNIAGFFFQKVSGVTTLTALNNNGDAANVTETTLTTITNNDSVELLMKMTSTSIKFYYRKNGGTLTLGATHTTRIPTAAETYISFMSTNIGTTTDFQIQIQCAAYEH